MNASEEVSLLPYVLLLNLDDERSDRLHKIQSGLTETHPAIVTHDIETAQNLFKVHSQIGKISMVIVICKGQDEQDRDLGQLFTDSVFQGPVLLDLREHGTWEYSSTSNHEAFDRIGIFNSAPALLGHIREILTRVPTIISAN